MMSPGFEFQNFKNFTERDTEISEKLSNFSTIDQLPSISLVLPRFLVLPRSPSPGFSLGLNTRLRKNENFIMSDHYGIPFSESLRPKIAMDHGSLQTCGFRLPTSMVT
jgi:hypothetical protein